MKSYGILFKDKFWELESVVVKRVGFGDKEFRV